MWANFYYIERETFSAKGRRRNYPMTAIHNAGTKMCTLKVYYIFIYMRQVSKIAFG